MAPLSQLSCVVAGSIAASTGAVRLDSSVDDILGMAEQLQQKSDEQIQESNLPEGNMGPGLWSFNFDPIPGVIVDLPTGRVEQVTGQARTKGVQVGWYVYKLDHHYKWSVGKWNTLVSSGTDFAITFSIHQHTTFNCHNLADSWVDSKNRGCSNYASQQMCTPYGTEGEGFPKCKRWQLWCREKTLDTFAVNGMSAAEACCTCGGGWDPAGEQEVTTTTTSEAPYHTYAPLPAPSVPPQAAVVDEPPAVAPAPTPEAADAVASPPKTSPGEGWECRNWPEAWTDRLGYACENYETNGWCANTDLDQYKDASGTSAYDACCACNGGGYFESAIPLKAREKGGASSMRAASGLLMILVWIGLC